MQSRSKNHTGQYLIALLIVAFLALAVRLVYISAVAGPTLSARANRQHVSVIPLIARRGLIVDSRGRIISGTLLRESVFADPQVLPDKQLAARSAAKILNVDPKEIVPNLLAAGDLRFFVIRRGVTEAQGSLIRKSGIYGLGVFTEPYRAYPMSQLAAALIGFVSPDGRGVSGLEYQCDAWLSGENGFKTIVRDARREAFWLADGGYRPARDGFNVVLTIDTEIQAVTERELAAAVNDYQAESGVAVVMHPATGAILAMANSPGFDPNRYRDYSISRYRNRTITDPYEPGSTFKPFVAAAALTEGLVRTGEMFDCEGGQWQDGKRTLRDSHPFDYLSFEEIVIRSSNIGMGKIGKRLGNALLYKYVKRFGFGEKTGVNLLGEASGILRPLSSWNDYSTTSIPIGQEIAVTPLQMARAFCVFANGGKLVTPYLIRAVMDAEGHVVSDLAPGPSEIQAIPAEIVKTMKDKILTEVVNRGTGRRARLSNYQVFGKTGTAQIAKRGGGGYQRNAYVGSFIGGAPTDNPQLVVLVVIRKPNRKLGYYGGTVAAPAVRAILGHCLAYLQVRPDKAPHDFTALIEDATTD